MADAHASDAWEASVGALDPSVRRLVADTSARRAALELRGAAAFTVVTQALIDAQAETSLVDMAARAIAQEIDHCRIYLDLARAYGGDGEPPRVSPIDAPHFREAAPDLRPLLRVIAMCAINETMACGFLELCLKGARVPVVREAVRRILADEIHHARIGWALLGSPRVSPLQRREIARWLVAMLDIHLEGWRSQIATLPKGAAPDHGCPGGAAIEHAALVTIRDVVVPGFAAAGVDVDPAQRWLAMQIS
jgi:hypothetical protein